MTFCLTLLPQTLLLLLFFWQIIFERNINIDTIVFNKVAVFVIDLVKSECE